MWADFYEGISLELSNESKKEIEESDKYNKAVKKYGVENVKSKGNRLMPIEERHNVKHVFAMPGTGNIKHY